jgi:hypothetical protein
MPNTYPALVGCVFAMQVFVQAKAWGPEAQAAGDVDTQITMLRFANGVFGCVMKIGMHIVPQRLHDDVGTYIHAQVAV